MTRRILTTLALLALTLAVSVGLLHAQGSTESERPPYRIDLLPGWNLISFPGDPVDPALENVIGDSRVDVILGYQYGEWLTAVRHSGTWKGTLMDMGGDSGFWVHTPVAEAIEVALSPETAHPTWWDLDRCTGGWELLAVVDREQRPASTAVDAEENFTQRLIKWRFAYGFDTAANEWEAPIRPGGGATVQIGSGYWVWSQGFHECGW